MSHFLRMAIGAIGFVALGRCLTLLLGMKRDDTESWGVSVVLGILATSWGLFLYSLAGGQLGGAVSWLVTAFSIVGVAFYYVRQYGSRSKEVSSKPDVPSRLALVCNWFIAFLIVAALVQTLLTPQRFWDERAIFAIKAKVLWTEGTIHSPVLQDRDFVQYHPKYPLLIPLAEQHVYALMGGVHDRWSKVIFPLMYAGLVLAFSGVLGGHFGRGWGALSGLLLGLTPVLMPYEYGFLSGQADAPMGCFHGLAVLYLWDVLTFKPESQLRSALLAGLFAASAIFTKDEGIAFLMVHCSALGLSVVLGRSPSSPLGLMARLQLLTKPAALFLGTVVLLAGAWLLHRSTLPDTTEMSYFGRVSLSLLVERLPTLGWSIPHLLSRMLWEWRTWGIQWWLVLAALVTDVRKCLQIPQQFLLWNLLGTLAALLVAGMVAPAELEEHLGGSTHRYLMQLIPVGLLFVASQWGTATAGSDGTGDRTMT
ncbi:MAG: hypothetical protein KDA88_05130 [Planctomycetaceae bacterium]|nr:hypothetical protein [Planctomycetaceae bacterium]MCB9952376.1 hypothetical protein [Planctomycetaceae bacterium]